MSNFRLKHNSINSIIDQVNNIVIDTVFDDLTVLRAGKNIYSSNLKLPLLVISIERTDNNYFQIGDNELQKDLLVIFDIYAKDEVYKEDLSDFLIDELIKKNFTYYEYSHISGDNKELSATANGILKFIRIVTDVNIGFGELGMNEKDLHRHRISFTLRRFP